MPHAAPVATASHLSVRALRAIRTTFLALVLTGIGACGGGDDSGGNGVNVPPIANFTASPTNGPPPLAVTFDAAGSSDSDGSIASYAWAFGDGSTASGVSATHTYSTDGAYTVTLTVTDREGGTAQATRTITVGIPPTSVTVSGRITFERVPFSSSSTGGLDYPSTFAAPARAVIVQLLRPDQSSITETVTDADGRYSLTAPVNADVFVRVKAQTQHHDPDWDVSVLNNTNDDALYVLDGATFNTGISNVNRDLLADSGWPNAFNATNYSGPRSAAPFAILDTVYSAIQFVLGQGDPAQSFPALKVFWSTQNRESADFDPDSGQVQSTSYRDDPPNVGIYLLGLASTDTDEFDQHVIAHEFYHFLEDAVSRSDTVGGSHSAGERLDMRVAFSEGAGNAFSAMVLADPVYKDSLGTSQSQRFSFDMDQNVQSPAGWYNEGSVQSLVWDLFDTAADGADAVSTGFQPMLEALRNEVRTGQALTSIFPFVVAVKARAQAAVPGINAVVEGQDIVAATMDPFATTETNNGGVDEALPVYGTLTLNGGQRTVCTSTTAGVYNKLGNRRFLRFSIGAAQSVTMRAQFTSQGSSSPLTPAPDPDMVLYRSGFVDRSEEPGDEVFTRTLEAGDYVLEVYEFSHVDTAPNAGRRGVTCMNVSVSG